MKKPMINIGFTNGHPKGLKGLATPIFLREDSAIFGEGFLVGMPIYYNNARWCILCQTSYLQPSAKPITAAM
jgi:hypothetical protein